MPKDCRNATPISCESGNTLILHPDEVSFNIVPYIESWTKYFHEEYVGDDEDDDDGPPPAKKAKTGISREFKTGAHVMVKYIDKWHHGIVTNHFGTNLARYNKKIKAGYVVDFIDETTWLDGLQPQKGKKMRSPDEKEEEHFADVDAAEIVEEAEGRFT